MLRLRPYKACDAQVITTWLKSEYAFRQWSADRYENYPITPDDMNLYYVMSNHSRLFYFVDKLLIILCMCELVKNPVDRFLGFQTI